MAWILKDTDGITIIGYATAPPSSQQESEVWTEVVEGDPLLQAFLDPVPEVEPDWTRFQEAIAMNPIYIRVALSTPMASYFHSQIVSPLYRVSQYPEALITVASLWNEMLKITPLTAVEVEALRAIVSDCKMRFTLDDQGLMILPDPH